MCRLTIRQRVTTRRSASSRFTIARETSITASVGSIGDGENEVLLRTTTGGQ